MRSKNFQDLHSELYQMDKLLQEFLFLLLKKMNPKYIIALLAFIAILFFGWKCYETKVQWAIEQQKAQQDFELEKYKLDLINKK